ncbi:flavodoxin family protein [Roseovarius sp. 2305UL8-3]|uniref:flavodoxin family protein n=1 Tax=Roseovarius conchicola TaxID=3121636 RepID=UPI0035273878
MAGSTVILKGSPRTGGNSDALADMFRTEAEGQGAAVQEVKLADLSYQGCINLFHCKTGGQACGQVDDLTPVLAAIAQAQVLVLASPVYFTSISGQLKLAMDRFFSFFVPDYPTNPDKSRLGTGRHLVFLQTQGEPEERYRDLMESFSVSFTNLGFDHHHLVRAYGVREPGDVAGQSRYQDACADAARRVYG